MKKSWWKIPLYCLVASWICFQLEVRLLLNWAVVTLPDGSVSTDDTRSMLVSALLFLVVVCLGGFLFFRRMTRKELFYSASALVILNVVFGLLTHLTQQTFAAFTILWSQLTQWDSVFSQLLFRLGLNEWLSAVLIWVLPPYIFLLFGRPEPHAG